MTVREFIRKGSFCALATSSGDRPHCSLMSYAADETGSRLFMITRSDTLKFRNLLANPSVSLLIDTRQEQGCCASTSIQALTIWGTIRVITEREEQHEARQRLIATHPDIRVLTDIPEAMFLCVELESAQLFEGLQHIPLRGEFAAPET